MATLQDYNPSGHPAFSAPDYQDFDDIDQSLQGDNGIILTASGLGCAVTPGTGRSVNITAGVAIVLGGSNPQIKATTFGTITASSTSFTATSAQDTTNPSWFPNAYAGQVINAGANSATISASDIHGGLTTSTWAPGTPTTNTSFTTGLALAANSSGQDRIDRIVLRVNSSGFPIETVIQGTPSATPSPPALTAGDTDLALVYCANGFSSISSGDIQDKRKQVRQSALFYNWGQLSIFGHSYVAAGTGITRGMEWRFNRRLAAAMGVSADAVVNYSMGGAVLTRSDDSAALGTYLGWIDILDRFRPTPWNDTVNGPYTGGSVLTGGYVAEGGLAFFCYGINDVGSWWDTSQMETAFGHALRTSLSGVRQCMRWDNAEATSGIVFAGNNAKQIDGGGWNSPGDLSSGATTTYSTSNPWTVTDTSLNMLTNAYTGMTVTAGAKTATVLSNTATVLTVGTSAGSPWSGGSQPANNTTFTVTGTSNPTGSQVGGTGTGSLGKNHSFLGTAHVLQASATAGGLTQSKFTWTLPADFPGGTAVVGFVGGVGPMGGTITWSGTSGVTGTTSTTNIVPTGTIWQPGMVKRFTGLSAGTQTIIGTVTSLDTGRADSVTLSATAGGVVVSNTNARVADSGHLVTATGTGTLATGTYIVSVVPGTSWCLSQQPSGSGAATVTVNGAVKLDYVAIESPDPLPIVVSAMQHTVNGVYGIYTAAAKDVTGAAQTTLGTTLVSGTTSNVVPASASGWVNDVYGGDYITLFTSNAASNQQVRVNGSGRVAVAGSTTSLAVTFLFFQSNWTRDWPAAITSTAGTTTTTNTTLADSAAPFGATNRYVGMTVTCGGKTATVTSNTTSTLTMSAGWSGGGNPGNGVAGTVSGVLISQFTDSWVTNYNSQIYSVCSEFAGTGSGLGKIVVADVASTALEKSNSLTQDGLHPNEDGIRYEIEAITYAAALLQPTQRQQVTSSIRNAYGTPILTNNLSYIEPPWSGLGLIQPAQGDQFYIPMWIDHPVLVDGLGLEILEGGDSNNDVSLGICEDGPPGLGFYCDSDGANPGQIYVQQWPINCTCVAGVTTLSTAISAGQAISSISVNPGLVAPVSGTAPDIVLEHGGFVLRLAAGINQLSSTIAASGGTFNLFSTVTSNHAYPAGSSQFDAAGTRVMTGWGLLTTAAGLNPTQSFPRWLTRGWWWLVAQFNGTGTFPVVRAYTGTMPGISSRFPQYGTNNYTAYYKSAGAVAKGSAITQQYGVSTPATGPRIMMHIL